MAVDSIMARPTNKVQLIVDASSGCWAIAVMAREIAIPSPIPGPIEPMPIVIPDATMEATAIQVVESMRKSFL
jgi:hypothetical protein